MSAPQVFNAVKFTRKGHVKVRLHVAKFSMEARKTDLKHSVSDSLTRASKLESTEDAVHMTDRKTEGNEILMGRSSLLKLRQLGGGESWDPLMEGGRRDLPELSVTEDEMGDTIRGKWIRGIFFWNYQFFCMRSYFLVMFRTSGLGPFLLFILHKHS